MSEYKKRRIKKASPEPKEYKMIKDKRTSKPQISEKPRFRLHKGGKKEFKLPIFVVAGLIIVLVSVYLIILAFHPIGVMEFIASELKSAGKGKGYDIELKGDKTITVDKQDDYYYTVTETQVICSNNNGKIIATLDHGFAKPMIESSETRCIIYGQGEQTIKVYNFDNELHNLHYESKILSADIANNGHFAVATTADGYDSAVTVYDKNGKQLFEWYSSNGIITSVKFLPNGKRISVSVINVKDGELSTNIRILNFKSADPDNVFDFGNKVCYDSYYLTKNNLCVVFEDSLRFIDVQEGSFADQTFDYSINHVEHYDSYLLTCGNLEANPEKNHIALYNKKGEKVINFSTDYKVRSVAYNNKRIYVHSDTFVNCYDVEGKLLSSAVLTFDVAKIVPIDDKSVAAVSDNAITKVKLISAE